MMKRTALAVAILSLVVILAVPGFAHRGGRGGPDYGSGYCWQWDKPGSELTDTQRTQLEALETKFYDETAKMRQDIWAKSDELNRLLRASQPDEKKIKALQSEISDHRGQIAQKRLDFELEARKIAPELRRGYGRGYRHGYGRHMGGFGPQRGFGPGACWDD